MESATKTYSSVHLRERDKILEEKHQKHLNILEGKLERLKRANDDTLKQLFDAQTRGNHLARSLGFRDIFEAQASIDTADYQTPYKECFERIDKLQQELLVSQDENESLRSLVTSLEERPLKELKVPERREVGCQTSASCYLSEELRALQDRYDDLLRVKESAAARHQADYTKWRNFKHWLFAEEAQHGNDSKAKTDKGKRQVVNVMRKKRKMVEIGPNSKHMGKENTTSKLKSHPRPPSLGGTVGTEVDKENLAPGLAIPNAKIETRRSAAPSLTACSSPTTPSTGLTHLQSATTLNNQSPTRPTKGPLSSPSVFIDHSSNTRRPSKLYSLLKKQDQESEEDIGFVISEVPTNTLNISSQISRNNRSSNAVINLCSSETEEDTQECDNARFDLPGAPSSPVPDTGLQSSQTEPDSQSQFDFPLPDPTPCPPRPTTGTLLAPGRKVILRDPDTLQPTKMLRLDSEVSTTPANMSTPKPKLTASRQEPLVDKKNNHTDQTPMTKSIRPLDGTGMKPLSDYSAYKGRGRYAQNAQAAGGTINAQFQIDPTQNGGLGFQYDEVVRDKNERKRMHAGDCECCSEYYKAVGPLPSRLQAPLWKSPPTTPIKPCERHQQHSASDSKDVTSTRSRQDAINSHKQAISRHRYHWERPKTPPGYWNIGFPDTQEAEDINQRAEEMHRNKLEKIKNSATGGVGPYRRRF